MPVRLGRQALEHAGANVLGVVLNRVAVDSKSAYGGYYRSGFTEEDVAPAHTGVAARESVGPRRPPDRHRPPGRSTTLG